MTQSELRANQQTIRNRHAASPAQIPHVPAYPMGFWSVMECSCWGRMNPSERAAASSWIPQQFWGCITERMISVPTAADFEQGLQALWNDLMSQPTLGITQ